MTPQDVSDDFAFSGEVTQAFFSGKVLEITSPRWTGTSTWQGQQGLQPAPPLVEQTAIS